ncbi:MULTISPECIES: T9SS type A sorting domain-containing protein [unclassified Lentimicrobium]|uniref:T9SS type A sorting domain-containing protein n=1 Tax=unclassified Lentimicrobium TaxID=2677434 RepID=UPI001553CB0E|nr:MULTISPECIES: T9SS type A sorting domain-containing protein [unclassified Lentimicrobium]NPD44161.1 T9SS type A sorting domain-containing protein [Lentimicrobium sp. S6]NPD84619.1 T9SS type A sorting domain-containing protein [Lentimicrobium sp. L6]
MKIKSTFILVMAILLAAPSLFAQTKDDFTVRFITLGNCYTCKVRVEAKLNAMEGVSFSKYDPFYAETTVTFDEFVTDTYIIMQAVADTGHDTEWFRAPDEAYQLLIGTCCEYERTINYDDVQMGYLSLMGIYVGHVAVNEYDYLSDISVFPSISSGRYSINLNDTPSILNAKIQVFSMQGQMVYSSSIEDGNNQEIDLTNKVNGTYMVMISSNGMAVSSTKIIKQ